MNIDKDKATEKAGYRFGYGAGKGFLDALMDNKFIKEALNERDTKRTKKKLAKDKSKKLEQEPSTQSEAEAEGGEDTKKYPSLIKRLCPCCRVHFMSSGGIIEKDKKKYRLWNCACSYEYSEEVFI